MVDIIDWKAWLHLAEEEFKYADGDLEDNNLSSFAQTCFHFHQAAEKYLKAYILAKGLSFRKIHNLTELINICTSTNTEFNKFLPDAAYLNPFYTDTRYPVHWPVDFTRMDAEKAKIAAQRIGDFVKSKMVIINSRNKISE